MDINHLLNFLFAFDPQPGFWPVQFLYALALTPWVALVESTTQRSRWPARIVRWLLLVVLFALLRADFIFWSRLVAVGVTALVLLTGLRQCDRGRQTNFVLAVLVVGAGVLTVAATMSGTWLASWLSCSLLLAGVFLVGSQSLSSLARIARCALLSIAAGLFMQMAQPELTVSAYLPLVAGGAFAWVALAFVWWRERPTGVKPKLKQRLLSAGIWLSTAVLSLLTTAELYFRFVYDASDANSQLLTHRRWLDRHAYINSWGQRDREIEPIGQFNADWRVLVLGDSFGFGQGIDDAEDMLHRQLEVELNRQLGGSRHAAVFNMGWCGINTERELALFEEKGYKLRPHVVVLAYVLNDIEKGVPHKPIHHPKLRHWRGLMRASVSLEFLIWRAYVKWGNPPFAKGPPPEYQLYQEAKPLARHTAAVTRLLNAVADAGAKLVVVIQPGLGLPSDSGVQGAAIDTVKRMFEQLGIEPLNAGEYLDSTDLSYTVNPFDQHPNGAYFARFMPQLAERVIAALPGEQAGP